MRVLYIGDPHATPDSIDEMERLVDYIIKIAAEEKTDHVCFLGDQFHTHSVIQLSVMSFWGRAFKRMKAAGVSTLALVGNHDKSGVNGATDNAMMLYGDITLFSEPTVFKHILFVPYVPESEEFVQICRANPTKTVICHQTFSGSVFENNFQIPGGVEPNDLPQEQVISGHIHKPQRVGKVTFPGASRWRTAADANTERNLLLVTHSDEDGQVLDTKLFPTAGVCRPIYALTDAPDCAAIIPEGDASIVVDIHGPAEYVDRRKKELAASHPDVRVRTFPATERVVKVRESDGLPVAMKKFFEGFKSKNGTPPEELWRLASERITWLRAT